MDNGQRETFRSYSLLNTHHKKVDTKPTHNTLDTVSALQEGSLLIKVESRAQACAIRKEARREASIVFVLGEDIFEPYSQ
jgi:hypothetical protein